MSTVIIKIIIYSLSLLIINDLESFRFQKICVFKVVFKKMMKKFKKHGLMTQFFNLGQSASLVPESKEERQTTDTKMHYGRKSFV